MSTLRFRTASGSLYEVEGDEDGGIWRRLEASPTSAHVRTDEGIYTYRSPISVGSRVEFVGPPITKGADARFVVTTEVKSIEGSDHGREFST